MTRPVRVPTSKSEVDELKRRVYDLERIVKAGNRTTPQGEPTVETIPFAQFGDVTLTDAGDSTAWRVRVGGKIREIYASLSTAGSSSTVVTAYKNGVSIGTVTLASSDTTETDTITTVSVGPGDKITVRVTTAGTGAKGLSGFIDIKG